MTTQLATRAEVPAAPDYGFGVRVRGSNLEETRALLGAALAAEGFGVVSEIDVRATLGEGAPPYLILGACDPELMRRALALEPYAGLLLPTSITLWPDGDEVIVTCANPDALARLTQDNRLLPIADEAEKRLRGALARLV
jgi:uncharacterized protein (DUF302 family)